MIAVKGNIEYTITDAEKNAYIRNGFDILDEEGKKIADGEHKTVSYEQFKRLKEKYEALKTEKTIDVSESEEFKKLEQKVSDLETIINTKDTEIDDLNKIIEEKDKEIFELNKAIEMKDKEIEKLTKKLEK